MDSRLAVLDYRATRSLFAVQPGSGAPGIRAKVECLAQTIPGSCRAANHRPPTGGRSVPKPRAKLQTSAPVPDHSSFNQPRYLRRRGLLRVDCLSNGLLESTPPT